MKNNDRFEEIVLYEIRQLRKDVAELKITVFANKLKLGFFVSVITVTVNLLITVVPKVLSKLF